MSGTLVLKGSHGAGIGDLLRSVSAAIAYAKLSDRELFVDWRGGLYGHPRESNLFDDLFVLTDVRAVRAIPEGAEVHPPRWANALNSSFTAVYEKDGNRPWVRSDAVERYSFDLGRLSYSQRVLVMWDFEQLHKLRAEMAYTNPYQRCSNV